MDFIVDLIFTAGWVTDGLNSILDYIGLWLDDFLYRAVAGLYDIFFAFTKLNMIDAFEGFSHIVNRVKVLLGLLMLFKLSFSFLTMLVSPDKLDSADSGAFSLFKNVVIVLCLLVAVTPAFKMLREVQTAIVEGGFLERLILGQENNGLVTDGKNGVSLGQSTAYSMYLNFFVDKDNKTCSNSDDESCKKIKEEVAYTVLGDGIIENYKELISQTGDAGIQYNKGFSTIGGIFLIIMLFSFIIDVGVRSFKLIFYEMLSSIAIMAYIEPKTQKALSTWLKGTMSTFMDLFIRIAIIYLAIILISLLPNLMSNELFDQLQGISKSIAIFLLIVSIWLFAKMLPKLFKDLFGIGGDGIELNPFKKSGLIGGVLGGAIGGGIGSVAGMALGFANGEGKLGRLAAAGSGFFAGGARGLNNGRKSKDLAGIFSNTNSAIKAQTDARNNALQNGNVINRGINRLGNAWNIDALKQFGRGTLNSRLTAVSGAAGYLDTAKNKSKEQAEKNIKERYKVNDKDSYIWRKSGYKKDQVNQAMENHEMSAADYAQLRYNTTDETWLKAHGLGNIADKVKNDENVTFTAADQAAIIQQIDKEMYQAGQEYDDLIKAEQKVVIKSELQKGAIDSEIAQLITQADQTLTDNGESGVLESLKSTGDITGAKKTVDRRNRDIQNDPRFKSKDD